MTRVSEYHVYISRSPSTQPSDGGTKAEIIQNSPNEYQRRYLFEYTNIRFSRRLYIPLGFN